MHKSKSKNKKLFQILQTYSIFLGTKSGEPAFQYLVFKDLSISACQYLCYLECLKHVKETEKQFLIETHKAPLQAGTFVTRLLRKA